MSQLRLFVQCIIQKQLSSDWQLLFALCNYNQLHFWDGNRSTCQQWWI